MENYLIYHHHRVIKPLPSICLYKPAVSVILKRHPRCRIVQEGCSATCGRCFLLCLHRSIAISSAAPFCMCNLYVVLLFLPTLVLFLPTPLTLASGGESDLLAFGPPAIFSVPLASSSVTSAGLSTNPGVTNNVVRMWVQLKR